MASMVRRGRTADADGNMARVPGPMALAHTATRRMPVIAIITVTIIPVLAATAITRTRLPSTLRRRLRRRPRLRRSAVMARFSTVVPASSIVTAAPAGVSRSV